MVQIDFCRTFMRLSSPIIRPRAKRSIGGGPFVARPSVIGPSGSGVYLVSIGLGYVNPSAWSLSTAE
jgi:hypothetical protein